MDVVVRTLVDTAPGRDGLVRRRVEVPRGSWVEAAAGPGGELWYVIDGTGLLASGDDPPAPIRRTPRYGCRRVRVTAWRPALRGRSRWTASRCPPGRGPAAPGRRSHGCRSWVTAGSRSPGTGGSGSCSDRATGARRPPSSWARYRPAAPRCTVIPT